MMKLSGAIIILFSLNTLLTQGQSSNQDLSKAEIFSSKPQALIEKQFIEIGYVDMIELRLMRCKNLSTGEILSALRFEYQTTNQVLSQTKLAIVDEDEIDGLIIAVKTIINNFSSEKGYYTEITFNCRSGFIAGAYYSIDTKKWMPYIQMNKNDNKSTVTVPKEEFKAFQSLLEKTKEQMKLK